MAEQRGGDGQLYANVLYSRDAIQRANCLRFLGASNSENGLSLLFNRRFCRFNDSNKFTDYPFVRVSGLDFGTRYGRCGRIERIRKIELVCQEKDSIAKRRDGPPAYKFVRNSKATSQGRREISGTLEYLVDTNFRNHTPSRYR